jgi:glucose/mannose-6-phosphate isomerase
MAVDSLGVLETLRSMPEQLAKAHETAGEALAAGSLPSAHDFDNVVVMGMGGSGIVGDVVQAVGTATLPVPLVVLKHYRTPSFVGPRTLAFAVSYSGGTEETLGMAQGALDAGATLVVITCGGALGELAKKAGALHIPCTTDTTMPRLALCAMVAPVFVVLFRMGMLPEAHAGMVKAQQQLAHRRDRCKPEVDAPANPARELARKIGGTIPIIHGAGGLGAVAAMRWKQSVNENAKAPAFWNFYPELDHNEICGWGQHGDITRQVFSLITLRHGLEHPQLEARMRITEAMTEEVFVQRIDVDAEGEGRIAQLLDLIYLGDWMSAYLALDHDVDPGPIDAIAQLKAQLG